MTTTTKPLTLTITRNGSHAEFVDGQLAAIIEALLSPKWKERIRAAGGGKVKITIDCNGSSVTPNITLY
jgi:hypothetical protein